MLLISVVISLSWCIGCLALSSYIRTELLDCGSTITASGAYEVSSNGKCSFEVKVPQEYALKMFIYQTGETPDCRDLSEHIRISDQQGMSQSICSKDGSYRDVIGRDGLYKVLLNNVPEGVVFGVHIVKTNFVCGDSVNMDLLDVPFTFTNNRDTENCYLVLPPGVVATLTSMRKTEEPECAARYEFAVGAHTSRMVRSTGPRCIGDVPAVLQVFCPAALIWNLQPGSSLSLTMRLPDALEGEMFEEKTLSCFM